MVFPLSCVEDVPEDSARVFDDHVSPVPMWCGLSLQVNTPEEQPTRGVVEVNPDVNKRASSTSGDDIVNDEVSGEVPRGRTIKASLAPAYWAHNRNAPTETDERRS